ncbi:DUF1634 domain-containing protein [Chitinophaga silvatica]|uniref:DUF1634 domain-containing protein n=1 Tax=Chitinophaga silvatica TaxID=2282649 RepID=A0A3E1YDB1_9BACT|nr:DUF1634 domain-containing protein [Chitinophaga silvatica]RFS24498.1 DUF1634 domain-containing protein [Chitinophaga silvatica]
MKQLKSLVGDRDIALFIGRFLRIGVLTACSIALIGGFWYLVQSGAADMPDYSHFTGEEAGYTTFHGIFKGVAEGSATEIIQLGVLVLLATPIFRVFFSLLAFALEKDWLYVVITTIVLGIILFSMFGGLKI